jgi:hypothetical protein
MDFSRLSQDERTAAWASIAVAVCGLAAVFSYTTYSGAWLGVIAAVGALTVLFLPQLAPGTRIPGSPAVWLLIAGGLAALVLVLLLVVNLGFVFSRFGLPDLLFLAAVVGAIVMAWAGWRIYTAEAGTGGG